MGGDRIRMGSGCLGWLSSNGVRGEAKRMGGGRSRMAAGCRSGDVGALAWLSSVGV